MAFCWRQKRDDRASVKFYRTDMFPWERSLEKCGYAWEESTDCRWCRPLLPDCLLRYWSGMQRLHIHAQFILHILSRHWPCKLIFVMIRQQRSLGIIQGISKTQWRILLHICSKILKEYAYSIIAALTTDFNADERRFRCQARLRKLFLCCCVCRFNLSI